MFFHATFFSCGFEACTEVNYQVSVSITSKALLGASAQFGACRSTTDTPGTQQCEYAELVAKFLSVTELLDKLGAFLSNFNAEVAWNVAKSWLRLFTAILSSQKCPVARNFTDTDVYSVGE